MLCVRPCAARIANERARARRNYANVIISPAFKGGARAGEGRRGGGSRYGPRGIRIAPHYRPGSEAVTEDEAGRAYSRTARVPTRLWTILTLMSDQPEASSPISWWLNAFNWCRWWLTAVVEVADSVIYRYRIALLLFLCILTIFGLCMGFWYLQAYHRETHEKIEAYHGETKKMFDDLKSDLGKNCLSD